MTSIVKALHGLSIMEQLDIYASLKAKSELSYYTLTANESEILSEVKNLFS